MDDLTYQYQYWIDKLGWVTPEMLSLVTRGVSLKDLSEEPDHRLEEFLAESVRNGKLYTRYVEGQPVYGSGTRSHGKSTNTYHDVMAAQTIVKLWTVFPSSKVLFTPGDFFAQNSSVIPDFGLTVSSTHGVHGFALEYQTFRESSRTTQTKIGDYWQHFEEVRRIMDADYLWVIFILERESKWVEEQAQSLAHSFIYLIDATTFLHADEIASTPIFLTGLGKRVCLVSKV